MKWYAGSDHAGYSLKHAMVEVLRALGDEVVDLGAGNASASVDYPDYAHQVAAAVAAEPTARGLLVCGTGIGMSMAANRVKGVRAARVTDEYSARMAREHNDANVVCLGERVTGRGLSEGIVRVFRDSEFAGGRHQRRVDKIEKLE